MRKYKRKFRQMERVQCINYFGVFCIYIYIYICHSFNGGILLSCPICSAVVVVALRDGGRVGRRWGMGGGGGGGGARASKASSEPPFFSSSK